jgi:hypothetical protein
VHRSVSGQWRTCKAPHSRLRLRALEGSPGNGTPSIEPVTARSRPPRRSHCSGGCSAAVTTSTRGTGRPTNRPSWLCSSLRERVGARRVREAPREMRGVPEPGIRPRERPGSPRSSSGAPPDRRVSDARRRRLLAARCRLRQAILGGRRRGVRRHVPCHERVGAPIRTAHPAWRPAQACVCVGVGASEVPPGFALALRS